MDKNTVILSITTTLFTLTIGLATIGLQFFFYGKVSDFYIAILSSFYWVTSIAISPFWGALSDVLGDRRNILIITAIGSGIILYLHTIFTNYWQIVFLRVLTALFASSYLPVSLALLTENVEKSKLGRLTSTYNFSRALGFFISGYIVSFIVYIFTDIWIFGFASLFMLISSLFLLMINKNKKRRVGIQKGIHKAIKIPGRGYLKNKRGYILVIALALRHIGLMGMYSIIFIYLTRVGIPKWVSSAISSFNTLTQMITMYFFGYIADKIGRKKVFTTGFFLSSLVPISFMISNSIMLYSLSFVLLGISFAALISGVTPFLREISPEGKEAEALSFLNIARGIGFIIGPIIAGILVSKYSYGAMFLSMFSISFTGALLSLLVEETLKR